MPVGSVRKADPHPRLVLVQAIALASAGAQHGADLGKDSRGDAAQDIYADVAAPQSNGVPIREPGKEEWRFV